MAYFAGKTGFLSFSGSAGGAAVNLTLEEWSLELETEEVEFTNFESFGQASIIGGIRSGTVSGSGIFDSVTSGAVLTEFSTLATSGDIVTIECGLDKTGTIGITVKAVLTGLTIGNNIKERATFEFTATLSNMNSTTMLPVEAQNTPLAAS